MFIFEITKTNTALPQKGLTAILIAYSPIEKKQSKVGVPIAGFPAPWVLSSAGKLIWYLHRSYFLPYRNIISESDLVLDFYHLLAMFRHQNYFIVIKKMCVYIHTHKSFCFIYMCVRACVRMCVKMSILIIIIIIYKCIMYKWNY